MPHFHVLPQGAIVARRGNSVVCYTSGEHAPAQCLVLWEVAFDDPVLDLIVDVDLSHVIVLRAGVVTWLALKSGVELRSVEPPVPMYPRLDNKNLERMTISQNLLFVNGLFGSMLLDRDTGELLGDEGATSKQKCSSFAVSVDAQRGIAVIDTGEFDGGQERTNAIHGIHLRFGHVAAHEDILPGIWSLMGRCWDWTSGFIVIVSSPSGVLTVQLTTALRGGVEGPLQREGAWLVAALKREDGVIHAFIRLRLRRGQLELQYKYAGSGAWGEVRRPLKLVWNLRLESWPGGIVTATESCEERGCHFFGGSTGGLVAFDTATGLPLWGPAATESHVRKRFELDSQRPAEAGSIFLGCDGQRGVTALKFCAKTGLLFAGDALGNVSAIVAATGEIHWVWAIPPREDPRKTVAVITALALNADGSILTAGGENGSVVGLRTAVSWFDGHFKISKRRGTLQFEMPVDKVGVVDGVLVPEAAGTNVQAIKQSDGKPHAQVGVVNGLLVQEGEMMVAAIKQEDGTPHAKVRLHKKDGKLDAYWSAEGSEEWAPWMTAAVEKPEVAWVTSLENDKDTQYFTASVGDAAIVAATPSSIVALEAQAGQKLWSQGWTGRAVDFQLSPVHTSLAFAMDSRGSLIALDVAKGRREGALANLMGNAPRSASLSSDGCVAMVSGFGGQRSDVAIIDVASGATRCSSLKRWAQTEGRIQGGEDLLVETMTVKDAKERFTKLPQCAGFTHEGSPTDKRVKVFFKGVCDPGITNEVSGTGWTSYRPEIVELQGGLQCKLSADGSCAIVGHTEQLEVPLRRTIRRIDTNTGLTTWEWEASDDFFLRDMQVTTDGKTVFATYAYAATLNAVCAITGEQLWQTHLHIDAWALRVSTDGELVFAVGSPCKVAAVLARTGEIKWTATLGSDALPSAICACGSLLVVGQSLHGLVAFRTSDGEQEWDAGRKNMPKAMQHYRAHAEDKGQVLIVTRAKCFAVNLADGQDCGPSYTHGNGAEIVACAFVPGRPWAVVGTIGGEMVLVDISSGVAVGAASAMRPQNFEDGKIVVEAGLALGCGSHGRAVFWDIQSQVDWGMNIQGDPRAHAKEAQWLEMLAFPVWLSYAIEAVKLMVTTSQILSFSRSLPVPPGPGSALVANIIAALGLLQDLGLNTERLRRFFRFAHPFFLVLTAAASMAWSYVLGVLVVNERLEDRSWYRPRSLYGTAFKLLCKFTFVVSSVGFIPLMTIFAKAIPCEGDHMREDEDIPCGSGSHHVWMALAVASGAMVCIVTWRLARVRFFLQNLEVSLLNPFDVSRDAVTRDGGQRHPLVVRSIEFQKGALLVSLIMVIARHCITVLPAVALTNLLCTAWLFQLGMRNNRFTADQVRLGRPIEPNNFNSAVDIAILWHFAGVFLATVLGRDAPGLWVVPLLTPAVAVAGYKMRGCVSPASGLHASAPEPDVQEVPKSMESPHPGLQVEEIIEEVSLLNKQEEVVTESRIHEVGMINQVLKPQIQTFVKEVALPVFTSTQQIVTIPVELSAEVLEVVDPKGPNDTRRRRPIEAMVKEEEVEVVLFEEELTEIPQVQTVEALREDFQPLVKEVIKEVPLVLMEVSNREVVRPLVLHQERPVATASSQGKGREPVARSSSLLKQVPKDLAPASVRIRKCVTIPKVVTVVNQEELQIALREEQVVEVTRHVKVELIKQVPVEQYIEKVKMVLAIPVEDDEEGELEPVYVEVRKQVPTYRIQKVQKAVPKIEIQVYERTVKREVVLIHEKKIGVPITKRLECLSLREVPEFNYIDVPVAGDAADSSQLGSAAATTTQAARGITCDGDAGSAAQPLLGEWRGQKAKDGD